MAHRSMSVCHIGTKQMNKRELMFQLIIGLLVGIIIGIVW